MNYDIRFIKNDSYDYKKKNIECLIRKILNWPILIGHDYDPKNALYIFASYEPSNSSLRIVYIAETPRTTYVAYVHSYISRIFKDKRQSEPLATVHMK